MNARSAIRKFLFVTIWITIGTGMVILVITAIGRKNHGLCKDYSIAVKARQNNFFIDEKDIQKLLVAAMNGNIKGQRVALFNLHRLEQLLEANTWIKDAELYFDNRNVLHVTIKEKEPIARIFTVAGNSFYIDSIGRKMPLSDKISARVPVFTGFPDKKLLNSNDSLLLNDVITTAKFIYNDPFWMAQVAQIDITPGPSISSGWNFEMAPVVGNHIVKLGNGENISQKFHRLFVFYKDVLSKTGFDKYKVIDVQYNGQVIGAKKPNTTKVDLVQFRKNVEKLLQEATALQNDTVVMAKPILKNSLTKVDSSLTTKNNPIAIGSKVTLVKDGRKTPNLNLMKTTSVSDRKPKAVMPKKE